jgi:sugar lactone lactonase YvrE
VLSLSPSATIHTIAGDGQARFNGDGRPATAFSFNGPTSLVFGPPRAALQNGLYVADESNQRIRYIAIPIDNSFTSFTATVAGNGDQGSSIDSDCTNGKQSTTLSLNNPVALAVLGTRLLVADSGNNRIRDYRGVEICDFHGDPFTIVGDFIFAFAGTGDAGFSGDGGQALAALFDQPSGVAVGTSVFIADTLNHRVRAVATGGTITTIAGNGTQGFSGDDGTATEANLDTPMAVAVDASGNVYIADSNNNRIRVVSGGIITTIAGNGTAAYTGDDGPATSASLNHPLGIALDSDGTLYIADAGNHVIRRVSNGTITTVAGNGVAAFSGDNGLPTDASLNTPSGVTLLGGDLFIADTNNNRIRQVANSTITFPDQIVGTTSAAQTVTLSNTGGSTLTIASIAPSAGDFTLADSGTCGNSFPKDISAGASCTMDIVFSPSAVGASNATFTLTDNAPGSPHILKTKAAGIGDGTTLSISASPLTSTFGDPVTFVATVTPAVPTSVPAPTGAIIFEENTFAIGFAPVTAGAATFSVFNLGVGTHNIHALYGGDAFYSFSQQNGDSTIVVNKATPAIASLNSEFNPAIFGNPANIQLQMSSTAAGLPTGTVTFSENGIPLATSPLISGSTSFPFLIEFDPAATVGSHMITATYNGDANYNAGANASFTQVINKADPIITWPAPAAIAPGTPLGPTQLNAKARIVGFASTPGTFVYSPPAGTVLAPGDHTLSVTFTPTDTNDINSGTATVSITVAQESPDYSVSSSPSSATIRAGQSATFTIAAAAVGGYTGQISLQCSNLPPQAACSFSPPQLNLNGPQASTTLTITTAATSAQLAFPPRNAGPGNSTIAWSLGLAGLLGMILLRGSRRTRKYGWLPGLFVILVVLQSCGGGGGSQPPPVTGTPPGSYSMSVTTTSTPSPGGTGAHALNLTLNVTN